MMQRNDEKGILKITGKVILFCLVFLLLLMFLSLLKGFFPPGAERLVYGVIGTIAAVLTTIIFLKFDKRSFDSIGLGPSGKTLLHFAAGTMIGVLLTIIMFASLIYFTRLEMTRTSFDVGNFLILSLALIPLAFMEELAFRGYPLVILQEKAGPRTAILITSLLFALYHIANGWAVSISFLGPGIWGLVFGAAAVYSKGIALPTGIHYAANLVQSSIGLGKDFHPIWELKESAVNPGDQQIAGFIIQGGLLVIAIFVIEYIIRKMRSRSRVLNI